MTNQASKFIKSNGEYIGTIEPMAPEYTVNDALQDILVGLLICAIIGGTIFAIFIFGFSIPTEISNV